MGRKVSTRCSAFGKEQAWKAGPRAAPQACGPRVGDMLAVYAAASRPTTRSPASRSGSARTRSRARAGRRCRSRPRAEPPRRLVAAGRRAAGRPAADDPRLRRRRRRRGRQRGHRPRGGPERRAGSGDETLDPRRTLLSELHDGTLAEQVAGARAATSCRSRRVCRGRRPPASPTAWLTAYRMLFTNSGVQPGATVLVQGAGGGVATALVQLGSAAGYRMWVTAATRPRARGPSRSAPTGRSSRGRGCPSGSTP